jgi:hypothetical protein
MTEECNNPHCPIHGNDPRAVRDRDSKRHIVTNNELMSAIRILAVNAHSHILHAAGVQEGMFERDIQLNILQGDLDTDPVVKGLVAGLVVLLRDHYPTQQFVGLCSSVTAEESILVKRVGEAAKRETEDFRVISLDEFMNFLGVKRYGRS